MTGFECVVLYWVGEKEVSQSSSFSPQGSWIEKATGYWLEATRTRSGFTLQAFPPRSKAGDSRQGLNPPAKVRRPKGPATIIIICLRPADASFNH